MMKSQHSLAQGNKDMYLKKKKKRHVLVQAIKISRHSTGLRIR